MFILPFCFILSCIQFIPGSIINYIISYDCLAILSTNATKSGYIYLTYSATYMYIRYKRLNFWSVIYFTFWCIVSVESWCFLKAWKNKSPNWAFFWKSMYDINEAWTQRYYNSWLSQYQTKSSESRNLDLNVTRRIKRVKMNCPNTS